MKIQSLEKSMSPMTSFLIVTGFAVAACVGLAFLSKTVAGWQVTLATLAGLVLVALLAGCGVRAVVKEGASMRSMSGALLLGCAALALAYWFPLASSFGLFVPFGLAGCITIWMRRSRT